MFVANKGTKSLLHLLHKILIAPVVADDHVGKGFALLVTPLVGYPLLALFGREVVSALQSLHGRVVIHLHDPDLWKMNTMRQHFVHQVVPLGFEQNGCLHYDDRRVAPEA